MGLLPGERGNARYSLHERKVKILEIHSLFDSLISKIVLSLTRDGCVIEAHPALRSLEFVFVGEVHGPLCVSRGDSVSVPIPCRTLHNTPPSTESWEIPGSSVRLGQVQDQGVPSTIR